MKGLKTSQFLIIIVTSFKISYTDSVGIKSKIFSKSLEDFVGGIPNSLQETGEQWDFPNAWPPSVQMGT